MDIFSAEIQEFLLFPNDEVDALLAAALNSFERELDAKTYKTQVFTCASALVTQLLQPFCTRSGRFAEPKTDKEIEEARTKGIPQKMREDTKYCVSLWQAWREHRKCLGTTIPPLTELNHAELQHWLTRFVLEVRKKDGQEFQPNTLHHICCGLMRYLRWNGHPSMDFFTDEDFADLKSNLDSEMKQL